MTSNHLDPIPISNTHQKHPETMVECYGDGTSDSFNQRDPPRGDITLIIYSKPPKDTVKS